ncbi:hypothetical protein MA3A0122R_2177 [Mycobacteroides abscessus 3A-0122-R]|nr:hypothetical protein MA3A0122R_2177 [Mycobacteroides abscessus 3A-0122-R]
MDITDVARDICRHFRHIHGHFGHGPDIPTDITPALSPPGGGSRMAN